MNIKHIYIINKIFNLNSLEKNILLELMENKFYYIQNIILVIIDNSWDYIYKKIIQYNFQYIIFYYDNNLHEIIDKNLNNQINLLYAFKLKNYLLK